MLEGRINGEEGDPDRTLVARLLDPLECGIRVAKCGVDGCLYRDGVRRFNRCARTAIASMTTLQYAFIFATCRGFESPHPPQFYQGLTGF